MRLTSSFHAGGSASRCSPPGLSGRLGPSTDVGPAWKFDAGPCKGKVVAGPQNWVAGPTGAGSPTGGVRLALPGAFEAGPSTGWLGPLARDSGAATGAAGHMYAGPSPSLLGPLMGTAGAAGAAGGWPSGGAVLLAPAFEAPLRRLPSESCATTSFCLVLSRLVGTGLSSNRLRLPVGAGAGAPSAEPADGEVRLVLTQGCIAPWPCPSFSEVGLVLTTPPSTAVATGASDGWPSGSSFRVSPALGAPLKRLPSESCAAASSCLVLTGLVGTGPSGPSLDVPGCSSLCWSASGVRSLGRRGPLIGIMSRALGPERPAGLPWPLEGLGSASASGSVRPR
jgi:hypothetical protein